MTSKIGRRLPAPAQRSVPGFRLLAVAVLLAVLMSVMVDPSHAWSADGHRLVGRLATASTPADLPDFFRGGSERVAAFSVEPDVRRLRDTPHLRAREYPEHYLDLELLGGAVPPASRSAFLELLQRKSLAPTAVGMLPYAIIEATEHLAIAFAEHRARPDDADIRAKALYLAGVLCHYAADLSQPLHTTVHHNGRARPDMSSPRTGIHELVDSLLVRTAATFSPPPGTPWPRPFVDLFAGIEDALADSHARVDRVYELEGALEWNKDSDPPAETREFATERLSESVLFTARLFATAWSMSEDLELPDWRFGNRRAASD